MTMLRRFVAFHTAPGELRRGDESGVLPGSRVVQRYLELQLDPRDNRAYLSAEVVEDVAMVWREGRRLREAHATVKTGQTSPSVYWDLLEADRDDLLSHYVVESIAALVAGDVGGKSAGSLVYNLFFLAATRDAAFRAWVGARYPGWVETVFPTSTEPTPAGEAGS